jgi:hypothetical protein
MIRVPFERRTTFEAAYDRRDPNPDKNYGIHGVDLRMELLGPAGATYFRLFTGWHWLPLSPALREEYPMPGSVGYHSPMPQYEGHLEGDCGVLPGGRCYSGSCLSAAAERTFQRLLREGSSGVWAELEGYYHDLFGVRAEITHPAPLALPAPEQTR